MGIFDLFKGNNIDEGVKKFRETEGAILLDVRTREEYAQERIPDSKNIPLQEIETIGELVEDKKVPLFVHCLSGVRSGQAVSKLKAMGYENVTNIGGISGYTGPKEK